MKMKTRARLRMPGGSRRPVRKPRNGGYSGPKYNSIDNIAEFFASRGKKFNRPQIPVEKPREARLSGPDSA